MIEPIDLRKLHMARIGKERSKAVESKYYGNPADHVKFASESKTPVKPGKDTK